MRRAAEVAVVGGNKAPATGVALAVAVTMVPSLFRHLTMGTRSTGHRRSERREHCRV